MLSFRGSQHVIPAPATNNQNPITCRHAAFQPPLPAADRKGVATANFIDGALSESRTQEIVDIIADTLQHRLRELPHRHPSGDGPHQGFHRPGVAPQVLPHENWNVRNFGWFPSFFRPGVVDATVTRRTATETAEVVAFINRELLAK
jgi:hypothetical protein